LATSKKNGFLTRASSRKPPQKQKATAFRHLEVIFSSALFNYIVLFQTCVFLFCSADLLYAEPKESNNNLTSHFLELLPDIIVQDNRKAPYILFMNGKLVVKENADLKRKRKDVLLTQTLGLQTKIHDRSLRKEHVLHSFICMCQRSSLHHRTWRKITFEFGESSGKLGLKMTNTTHTDERKMV